MKVRGKNKVKKSKEKYAFALPNQKSILKSKLDFETKVQSWNSIKARFWNPIYILKSNMVLEIYLTSKTTKIK